jgi:hypothetical protein
VSLQQNPFFYRYYSKTYHMYRLAYRSGVTYGITPPASYGFLSGISTAFSYGAAHRLEEGALVKKKTALHVHVRHGTKSSISTQIGALRRILLGSVDGELAAWSKDIREVN